MEESVISKMLAKTTAFGLILYDKASGNSNLRIIDRIFIFLFFSYWVFNFLINFFNFLISIF